MDKRKKIFVNFIMDDYESESAGEFVTGMVRATLTKLFENNLEVVTSSSSNELLTHIHFAFGNYGVTLGFTKGAKKSLKFDVSYNDEIFNCPIVKNIFHVNAICHLSPNGFWEVSYKSFGTDGQQIILNEKVFLEDLMEAVAMKKHPRQKVGFADYMKNYDD